MIFNAALEEFAEHGYHNASTNRMIRKAGISKGTLFYYFNSKQELFQDLVDYSLDVIRAEYLELIDDNERDFVEKYRQASKIKLDAYYKHHQMFAFFGKIYLNPEESLLDKEAVKKMEEIRVMAFSKFYDNVDTSLFRDDIPAEQVMQLIRWTLDGYEKELTKNMKDVFTIDIDYTPYWKKFYGFLDTLKHIYYKEGK